MWISSAGWRIQRDKKEKLYKVVDHPILLYESTDWCTWQEGSRLQVTESVGYNDFMKSFFPVLYTHTHSSTCCIGMKRVIIAVTQATLWKNMDVRKAGRLRSQRIDKVDESLAGYEIRMVQAYDKDKWR